MFDVLHISIILRNIGALKKKRKVNVNILLQKLDFVFTIQISSIIKIINYRPPKNFVFWLRIFLYNSRLKSVNRF